MTLRIAIVFVLSVGLFVSGGSEALSADEIEVKLKSIKLPPGFTIALYADDLPAARSLAIGDKGTVFVSTRNKKHVYAVVDTDGDSRADETHIVFTLGDVGDGKERAMPNGIAFRDGDLYIATPSTVLRLDDIEGRLSNPPKPVVISESYPTERTHGWKFIGFGPDDKLYLPVGTPCNICDSEEDIYGTISRINIDGSGREIIAHGIRNTVGFDWHPDTGDLWFTDHGADGLGDNIPADELNVVTRSGQHFGFPFVHQGDLLDAEFGEGHDPKDYAGPAMKLGAHVAPLGMHFYTGSTFPEKYKKNIFIAEHGSSTRDPKIGYRITLVQVTGSKATAYEDFATGWIEGEPAWGRPVDLVTLPDGSLLVSDDRVGAVYRIQYDQ
jgi:glucose/arabinose dehydrogenase